MDTVLWQHVCKKIILIKYIVKTAIWAKCISNNWTASEPEFAASSGLIGCWKKVLLWAEVSQHPWRKIISIFGIILKFRAQHQSCMKKRLSLIYCYYKISLNFAMILSKNLASHEERASPGNNGSKERVMSLVWYD